MKWLRDKSLVEYFVIVLFVACAVVFVFSLASGETEAFLGRPLAEMTVADLLAVGILLNAFFAVLTRSEGRALTLG